jgi:hypothetical protein
MKLDKKLKKKAVAHTSRNQNIHIKEEEKQETCSSVT